MCIILFLNLVPINIPAAEIKGVVFDDSYRYGQTTLSLVGAALLKYLIFIDAYVAAFYLPEGIQPQKALDDVPKRLEIQYFHGIKAEDFASSTNKFIADNQSPETVAALRPKIDRINALYENVRPGDRYALTYIPGEGTTLSLNGKAKGTIQGADFSAAIFSIWLGSKPLDTTLKRQLLGEP
jgi:hypothetical protein